MKKIQVLLALGLVFGMGFVAHAGPSDVIHGCVKRNQVLRVSADCSSTERAIEWSQAGPQGPVGPAGPAAGFVMVSGQTEPLVGWPFGETVTCPDGLSVIAASAWTEDRWDEMFRNIPVQIAPNGSFEHSVFVDWHLWWSEGDVASWNVTCGAV